MRWSRSGLYNGLGRIGWPGDEERLIASGLTFYDLTLDGFFSFLFTNMMGKTTGMIMNSMSIYLRDISVAKLIAISMSHLFSFPCCKSIVHEFEESAQDFKFSFFFPWEYVANPAFDTSFLFLLTKYSLLCCAEVDRPSSQRFHDSDSNEVA